MANKFFPAPRKTLRRLGTSFTDNDDFFVSPEIKLFDLEDVFDFKIDASDEKEW